MDNSIQLGFYGNGLVRYADILSGSERKTMIGRVRPETRTRVDVQVLVFKYKDRKFPTKGVPNNIPRVLYCTSSET